MIACTAVWFVPAGAALLMAPLLTPAPHLALAGTTGGRAFPAFQAGKKPYESGPAVRTTITRLIDEIVHKERKQTAVLGRGGAEAAVLEGGEGRGQLLRMRFVAGRDFRPIVLLGLGPRVLGRPTALHHHIVELLACGWSAESRAEVGQGGSAAQRR